MISFKNVFKSYDHLRPAVEDLTLTVARGSIQTLVGKSGCGKTTTLKMINRLVEPSAGEICVKGKNISGIDPIKLRRSIGYVFQEVGLLPHMTVGENVAIVPGLLGWSQTEINNRTNELLEMVELVPDKFLSRYPRELSGGQQQRVGLARALAGKPEIMLMDEPFGALDPITRAAVADRFKYIQRELSLTVIMVTHDMTEALLLSDRIAVMKAGKIISSGTPEDLIAKPGHPYAESLISAPKNQAQRLKQIFDRDNK